MTEPSPNPTIDPTLRSLQRRNMIQAVLMSAIIFVAGGAVGFGVAALVGPRGRPGMPMPPDPPVEEVVRNMQNELSLTMQQTEQIKKIYTERFTALRAIRKEMGPRLTTEYATLRTDVEKVLTPEQFTSWNRRFEAARDRMMPPPPRPNGQGNGPPDGPQDGNGPPDRRRHDGPPPPPPFDGPGGFPPDGPRGRGPETRPDRPPPMDPM